LLRIPLDKLRMNADAARAHNDADDMKLKIASIEEHGQITPLDVIPAEDGKYEIVAGCGRFVALQMMAEMYPERGKTALCRVVDPSAASLSRLWHENYARRKFSSGARVIAYLEAHPAEAKSGRELEEFLGLKQEAVVAAKAIIKGCAEGRDARFGMVRQKVMSGSIGIRDWKTAFEGLSEKGQPRKATNYDKRVVASCASLANTFKNWDAEVLPEHYPLIIGSVRDCLTAPAAPTALLHDLHAALGAELQKRKEQTKKK